jgi:hypothetical protein
MTIKRDSSDLSTAAQTAKMDRLDAAIDQVTACMVHVREDEEFASRIARALPERASRFGWLLPQCAAITALAIAAGVWMLRDTSPASLSPLPSSDVVAVLGVPNAVVAVEPGTIFRPQPVELLEPLEPLELLIGPDFDRSLAPIAPMTALVVSDLSPSELPAAPALELAPIELADLPLTADSFPPR